LVVVAALVHITTEGRDEEAAAAACVDDHGGDRKGVKEGIGVAYDGGKLRERADREEP
jgi:hypothetical protein